MWYTMAIGWLELVCAHPIAFVLASTTSTVEVRMHTLATCKVLYHSMHTTVKADTQGVGVALLVNNDKIL